MTISTFAGVLGDTSMVSTELGRSSWSTNDQDVLDMLWAQSSDPQTLLTAYAGKSKPVYKNSASGSGVMTRTFSYSDGGLFGPSRSTYRAQGITAGIRVSLYGQQTVFSGGGSSKVFSASFSNAVVGRLVGINSGTITVTLNGVTYSWSLTSNVESTISGNSTLNFTPSFSRTESYMYDQLSAHGVSINYSINLT